MIDAGDVYLADLGEERRRLVVVVSRAVFQRRADRALVAPEQPGSPDKVAPPWRVTVGERVFAVDHIRSVRPERLLELHGRATPAEAGRIASVLRRIVM